jgi:hypothetical protein
MNLIRLVSYEIYINIFEFKKKKKKKKWQIFLGIKK